IENISTDKKKYFSSENISLRINLKVHEEIQGELGIGIIVRDENENIISILSTVRDSIKVKQVPEKVTCNLLANPLPEGKYSLSVSITDELSTFHYDRIDYAIEFDISTPANEFYLERVDTVETVLLTRIRNESDIIEDFLNHVNDFSDGIIVFDDSSTDNTLDIVRNHPKVVAIVKNVSWDPHNRTKQETLHRKALNIVANKLFSPKWIIYMDADERLEGNVRQELAFIDNKKIDYIRIPLFDAYMTKNDCKDISPGETLLNRRLYREKAVQH
ncbi:glycosyltransferase family 2 protein, partial [Vibrio cholerae]